MSMMPATRIELKKDLSPNDVQQACRQIMSVAGQFNVLSNGNPTVLVVSTSDQEKLAQIRKMKCVARVGHQL